MKYIAPKMAGILIMALIYIIVGKLGLLVAIPPGYASAIWPPSGIALAAVLWWGYWLLPGVFLGAFLLNSWISLGYAPSVISFALAGCIAVGSTLQALLGGVLVRRFIGSDVIFERSQGVFKFVGLVALSVFTASIIGTTSLGLFGLVGRSSFAYTLGTWWMGDFVGIILFTPLILICLTPQRFQWNIWRIIEFILLVVLLWGTSLLIFGGYLPLSRENYPIVYPLILFVLWIAFRFTQREMLIATFLISILALWGTAQGVGPFFKGSLSDSLLFMQGFMAIITLTGLLLSATLSERKEIERSLEKERDQAQQYLDIAGVLIVALDTEGRVTLINKKGQEYLGYSEAEIIGRNWFEVCLPPRIREQAKEAFSLQMEGAIEAGKYFESAILNKSGEERLMAFRNSVIRGPSGRNLGMLFSGEDITVRKKAEEERLRFLQALKQERDFNAAILNSMGSVAVVLDLEGRFVLFNHAAELLSGYKSEEVLGKYYWELFIRPEEREMVRKRLEKVEAGQLPVTGENYWKAKDGSLYWLAWSNTALLDEQGKIQYILATGIDRTEAKRTEKEREQLEALKQADALKDQFLGVVSHELRTPLNIITGFASILEDEVAGQMTAQQHLYIRRIIGGADLLLSLVNDLLDMTRIQAGAFSLSKSPMSLKGTLQNVCESLLPLIDRKRLTFSVDIPAELPPIFADEQRVGQILLNLLSNAIKFTPDGGTIRVEAYQEDGFIICEVKDSGIGIAPENLPKLFKPFSQLDTGSTRRVGGTGLGLSITKALVEAHGGTISASSPGPGQGSCFRFSLPINPSA